MPSSPAADFRRHEAQSKTDMETLCLNMGMDSCAPNQLYLKMAGREDEKEDEEEFLTLGGTSYSKGLAVEEELGRDNEGMAYRLIGNPIGGESPFAPQESDTSSHSGGDLHSFLESDLGRAEAEGGGSEEGDYSDFETRVHLNFSDSPRGTASRLRVMNSNSFPEPVEGQVDMLSCEDSWFKGPSIATVPALEGRCADDALHFSIHDEVALSQDKYCMRMDVRGAEDFCTTDHRNVAMRFPNLSISPESVEESERDSLFERHVDMDDLDF